jgi:AraC-like DNA-binding protein
MSLVPADYFRYFPRASGREAWGLQITGAGFTRIPPRSFYPPARHPEDHRLDWRKGRVLDALQIVLITAGRGWLETRAVGKQTIVGGMAFLLLPNVWHRYRPDSRTGWSESWVELQGATADALLASGELSAKAVVARGMLETGLDEQLDIIHRHFREAHAGFDPELVGVALRALAIFQRGTTVRPRLSRTEKVVGEVERYFSEHAAEPLNIMDVARRHGVAYSHFRRVFLRKTGLTPWQYVVQLRLMRARKLLASTDATLEEIASLVGFSSSFHLSFAFKKLYGQPPSHWRASTLESSL